MNYSEARKIADEVVATLRPLCIRCEIAGSVRRQKQDNIKDVEIVSIPNPAGYHELRRIVNSKWGKPALGEWPSKYTKIRTHVNLDLFWTTPMTWGLIYLIRTGPAEYCERLLSYWKTITNGGYSQGGILHLSDGAQILTPEETDVFEVLERYGKKPCPFQPPEKRTAYK